MFTKGEISASLWVLPDCVGSPGTAGMGVTYFQLQSYCQPGHSTCPDLWKCVSATSYMTCPSRKLSCFLAALGSLELGPGWEPITTTLVHTYQRLVHFSLSTTTFSFCAHRFWIKAAAERIPYSRLTENAIVGPGHSGLPLSRWSAWLHTGPVLFP